ncbi:uncharacterized protein RCC_05723 [Ramularia collo-cygni]|uniref:Uncharacterized protein n=1 Tax=Ramularia collo-cygni TaxID=112498 RepID=A0A2D3V584_9PEZI|nr:uncharacterized protein RCC_05723 [Ramularia collo-cygni]CZT19867.1 uncharacterized protein RCC_05723 [Ramularia collo-cygni]
MLLLLLGLLLSISNAQSLTGGYNPSIADPTQSCLKRSVFVYTSASSTYMVTDLGSASPSSCSNTVTLTSTSISTVTVFSDGANQTITSSLPASTITILQPAASSLPITNQTIDFDAGSPNYETASSGPQVSADVVSAGPLLPNSGDNYLLITFSGGEGATRAFKRQANQPQSYNVTQPFPASAGRVHRIHSAPTLPVLKMGTLHRNVQSRYARTMTAVQLGL